MVSNNENLFKSLFKQADERIHTIEAEKQRLAKEKEELEKNIVKEATEKYADAVLLLANNILVNATATSGPISNLDHKNMGYPISNDKLDLWYFGVFRDIVNDSHTGYKLDQEGLHIILNYSRYGEGCVDATDGGDFDDENIDYNYLNKLLNPSLVYVEKIEKSYCNGGDGQRAYVSFIKITVLREKKLEKQPVSYVKTIVKTKG